MEFPPCAPAKLEIFASLAELAQAIGHTNRLELLEHLAQGTRSVEELTARSGMTFANTSRHLQILRRARLVATERDGKRVLYRLSGDPEITRLMRALGKTAEAVSPAVAQTLEVSYRVHDRKPAMTREDLFAALGKVTVVDVRAPDEFAQGHLPGAINIPAADLAARCNELASPVVLYCRGPYCVQAYESVAILRAHGMTATRLEDGFPEWKAQGFPIET